MRNQSGFTLIESIIVIILLTIISTMVSPLFKQTHIFEERFFLDQTLMMLRYGHKVATSSGCEVQLGYLPPQQLALFQRQACTTGEFNLLVPAPFLISTKLGFVVDIPKFIKTTKFSPVYIDAKGLVMNSNHEQQKTVILDFIFSKLIIDGETGFAYEANKLP